MLKNKVINLCSIALLSLGATYTISNETHSTTNTVQATAQGFANMPKAVQINKGTEMPGQYTYHPKIMPGITKVHAFGDGVQWYSSSNTDNLGTNQYVVFDTNASASIAAKGKMGVYYENTGTYDGHQIDTKFTILDWDIPAGGPTNEGAGYHRMGIGTNFFGLDEPGGYPSAACRVRVDNIDHDTGKPIKLSGYYSFMDLDGGQAVGLDDGTMNKVSAIYYTPDTTLTYKKANDEHLLIGEQPTGAELSSGGITLAYDDTSNLTFTWYSTGVTPDYPQEKLPEKNLRAANEIGSKLSNYYDANAGKTADPVNGSVSYDSFHGSWVEYGSQAILPAKPTKPQKFVSDKDEGTNDSDKIGLEKSVTHNTLGNRYEKYHYQIMQRVPDVKEEFKYHSYEISDDIDKVLNTSNIHVYNQENQDVTYLFTITNKDSNIKAIAKPSSLKQDDFYNEVYKVTFDAEVKPGVSLADHKDPEHADQALITNKPVVTIDEDSVEGNITKTNIPFTKNDTSKSVSNDGNGNGTSLNVDFGKEYKYRVDATAPDNEDIKSYSIEDKLEDVLDLKDVKVYDYDDKDNAGNPRDITKEGKLTTDKNDITWTATAPSKWHGKHIKMIIGATVKNNADLVKYLNKDNKIEIPNKATMKINDKPKTTNTVEVTPNTPDASVSKKIEVTDDSTGQQIDSSDLKKQENKENEPAKKNILANMISVFNLFHRK